MNDAMQSPSVSRHVHSWQYSNLCVHCCLYLSVYSGGKHEPRRNRKRKEYSKNDPSRHIPSEAPFTSWGETEIAGVRESDAGRHQRPRPLL